MSTRNVSIDNTYLVGTKRIGHKFTLASGGANWPSGSSDDRVFDPHPYTLNLVDRWTGLYESPSCIGKPPTYGVVDVGPKPRRAWDASDEYKLYAFLEEQYDKGDFNAGVFAGELGKTADLLAARTIQVARAVMAVKNGRFAKAKNILIGRDERGRVPKGDSLSLAQKKQRRDQRLTTGDGQRVSDAWLELQYGWKPLLSDIYNLSDQIAQYDKPRKRRIRAARSITYGARMSAAESKMIASGGGRYGKQIIAYITEDIPSWPAALGLTSPELVAWELVPFSFVADWFLPIGGYLQARSFASRAKGTFVITVRDRFHGRFSHSLEICSVPYVNRYKMMTPCYLKTVSLSRTVHNTLPQVPLPSFGNGLGRGNRLANAIALVTSIFTGRK